MSKEPNNRKNAQTKKQRLVAMRQMNAAQLYLRGYHQQYIADELKVSVATICNDLKSMHTEWKHSASVAIDEKIALELAKLDEVEATAWKAFEESKETSVSSHEKGTTTNNTAGDARFLSIIQSCIEKRCKILGIDSPDKLELSGRDGEPIQIKQKMDMAVNSLAGLIKSENFSLKDDDD